MPHLIHTRRVVFNSVRAIASGGGGAGAGGGGAGVPTTFDPTGSASNATLSNGDLTATSSSAANGGARSIAYKTTGLYYFEITIGQFTNGVQSALGLVSSAGTYANMHTDGTNSCEVLMNSGTIFSNNTTDGKSVGAPSSTNIIGIATNLTTRKAWFRRNGGNWNGNVTFDPFTDVGSVPIAATVGFAPAVAFGPSHSVNDAFTANFGATAFANTAPTGFGNWLA